MLDQLPAIVVLAPLFGALVTGLAGPSDHRRCFPIVISVLTISLLGSIALLGQVIATGPVDYFMGGWDDKKSVLGVGIHLRVDTINGILLVVIATVSMLTAIFSFRRAGEENTEKTPQFYMLFQMLAVGLMGITITGDAFNLFVLIEVSSLTRP